ncbi:MAG: NAD(P)-binding domain-containing protein [Bacteroidia bacterium]|nr:NAD(P)-binding domain-containing protein [Bacteroidia bacterium]MDW8015006.1 NAD(P)-binding domain-containing protein [Bacteroidia bacterium]
MTWDVIVVGAGPSGLAGIRRLKEAGLSVIAFEKRHDVGGVWLYEDNPEGHSSAYQTLTMITSKACSHFEDFPFPKEWPDYVPHYLAQRYLRNYAEHFGLIDHIRFHTAVESATPTDSGWVVHTSTGETFYSRYLVAATGHHWKPYLPTYPGHFTGESYHSHAYKRPMQLANKRVLIVGIGNSGADIAVDAVRVAQSVDLSTRRGYHVLPKFVFFGIPADEMYRKVIAPLPKPLRRIVSNLTLKIILGPVEKYGMPKPDHPLFYTHPLMNSELLYHLRHGKIRMRPGIQRLEEKKVYFTDGSVGEYDTIVWATGYEVEYPYLPSHLVPSRKRGDRIYLHIFHLDEPHLFYLGLIQPNGCIWNLAEKQAALVARYIMGAYKLPPDVEQQTEAYWRQHAEKFAESLRHIWEVEWYEYAEILDKLIARHPLPKKPVKSPAEAPTPAYA